MHPPELRDRALALRDEGIPFSQIWRTLGLPRGTVRYWLSEACARQPPRRRCPRCSVPPQPPEHPGSYAYLLGLYLGDGHLATTARVPVLRISRTSIYPHLIAECDAAMRAVLATSVQRVRQQGCTCVQSYGKHWPCLLPQHGPGKKHERPIVLADWQEPIVDGHAEAFVRGPIHSDGSRFDNRVTVRGHTYSYPRYMFTNESAHIMDLCRRSLDRLGVEWRMSRRNTLSVAKRASVLRLDEFVGAKS